MGKVVRKIEDHTLDEGLGEIACSVTVTVGCSEGGGAVVCTVMTVNAGDIKDEASKREVTERDEDEDEDGDEDPGNETMLEDSVVKGPLTELRAVLDGRPREGPEVPDTGSVSWK